MMISKNLVFEQKKTGMHTEMSLEWQEINDRRRSKRKSDEETEIYLFFIHTPCVGNHRLLTT